MRAAFPGRNPDNGQAAATEVHRVGGSSVIESVVLIEGPGVNLESLGISLGNAKQVVIGRAGAIGVILHVAANSPADLGQALLEFAQVPGVTGVSTLALRLQ